MTTTSITSPHAVVHRRGSRADALVTPLLFVAALALYGYQAYPLKGFYSLHAFNDLVYSRSVAEGFGLTYMGADIHAWTDLLWVTIVAAFDFFFSDLLTDAQYAGLVFGVLTMLLLLFWSFDLFDRYWPGALAGILLASIFEFAAWSAAGTDTLFFTFLLTLALWLHTRAVKVGHYVRSSAAWCMLILARPEGLVLAAVAALGVAGVLLFGRERNRLSCVVWLVVVLSVAAVAVRFPYRLSGAFDGSSGFPADPSQWLSAFLLERGALMDFQANYREYFWTIIVMAAITLERGPLRLAGSYVFLYLMMAAFVVCQLLSTEAQTTLGQNYVPLLPTVAFVFSSGLCMLVYHRPNGPVIRLVYFLLLIVMAGGLVAMSVIPREDRMAQAHREFVRGTDLYQEYAQLVRAEYERTEETDPAPVDREVPRVAAFNAPALTYFSRYPVGDLTGRHVPAAQSGRGSGDWALGDDPAVAPEQVNARVVILPVELGELEEAPIFLRHPDAARLYYSADFQRRYGLDHSPPPTVYRLRPRPFDEHLMTRFFDATLTAEVRNVAYERLPFQAHFTVANQGSGSYLSTPTPANVGYVAIRTTWRRLDVPGESLSYLLPLSNDLNPGDSVEFLAPLPKPDAAGVYAVAFSLELAGVRNFAREGRKPVSLEVELVAVGDRPTRPRQLIRGESSAAAAKSVGGEAPSGGAPIAREPLPLPTPIPSEAPAPKSSTAEEDRATSETAGVAAPASTTDSEQVEGR